MTTEFLIGPGKLYSAPVGTANPDESTVAYGAAWGGSWTALGDLLDGGPATLTIAEEFAQVTLEAYATPVKATRTGLSVMLKATLANFSVGNWERLLRTTAQTTAAAGGGQKGYSDLAFGAGLGLTILKFGIETVRQDSAGVNQPVRWFFHRGYIRLAGDVVSSKAEPTGMPVEITVLADTTQSAGQEMGMLQIVTAAATAT